MGLRGKYLDEKWPYEEAKLSPVLIFWDFFFLFPLPSKFSYTLNSPEDGENEEAAVGDAREAVADAVDSLWKPAVFTRSSVVFTW